MRTTNPPRWTIWTPLAASTLVLAACQPGTGPGLGGAGALSAAQPGKLQTCEALATSAALPNTRIVSSERVATGAMKQGDRPLPEHCLVKGRMHERKGADGRDYAIGFEMRLPVAWNGRFYYQGNGGLDGTVQPALGALGGGPPASRTRPSPSPARSRAGTTAPNPRSSPRTARACARPKSAPILPPSTDIPVPPSPDAVVPAVFHPLSSEAPISSPIATWLRTAIPAAKCRRSLTKGRGSRLWRPARGPLFWVPSL